MPATRPSVGRILRQCFLRFLAVRTRQFDDLRHLPAHFVLDDFGKRYVRGAHVPMSATKGRPSLPPPEFKLTDAAGDQVHQNVGVTNLLQCLFCKFSVQSSMRKKVEREILVGGPAKAIINFF